MALKSIIKIINRQLQKLKKNGNGNQVFVNAAEKEKESQKFKYHINVLYFYLLSDYNDNLDAHSDETNSREYIRCVDV